jgi:hypothetical protein
MTAEILAERDAEFSANIAQIDRSIDQMRAEIKRLSRWQAEALEWLGEMAEHFDNEADADWPQGADGYIPNAAMRFLGACHELTASARVRAWELFQ